MTLRELLVETMKISGSPISDVEFISYVNNAISELSLRYDTAKALNVSQIVCTNIDSAYDLPEGGIGLKKVVRDGQGYYTNYEITLDGKIKFGNQGNYTVYVDVNNPRISSMSDAFPIHSAYQMPVIKYCAYEENKRLAPELAATYKMEFLQDAELTNRNLRKMQNKNKKVYAPLFR